MDPLTTIGLVANIVAFVDFGYKVIHISREVQNSVSGATVGNDNLEVLTEKMQGLALDLKSGKPVSAMTADELRLNDLVKECQGVSEQLMALLGSLKAATPNSRRHALGAVLRNVRRKDKKDDLEARLDKCRQQLHLQLSQTSRLEALGRLDSIQKSGECQKTELEALCRHVAALHQSFEASSLGQDLLTDLKTLLDRSSAAMNKVVQSKILGALCFERMHDRSENIEEAHVTTFKWILEQDTTKSEEALTAEEASSWRNYQLGLARDNDAMRSRAREAFAGWLKAGQGVFHISGKPGAGKSTLMKYLSVHPRTDQYLREWAGEKHLVLAKFFFWRHGTDYQKSFKGLLRSLLHSILTQCPELIGATFPEQWESARQGMHLHFDHSHIKDAFNSVMLRPDILDRHVFTFFIDGLDEFEGREDHLVRALFDWVRSRPGSIKICVSSRELPIFQERFSACPKFRLHELTQVDILIFVQDVLRNNEDVKALASTHDFTRLGRLVVDKAEGVFLWVSLALKAVEQGLLAEDRMEDLEKKIDFLPSEVDDLFRVIFDSIEKTAHPFDLRRAMKMIAIVLGGLKQPLQLQYTPLLQLSFLDEFTDNSSFANAAHTFLTPEQIDRRKRRCRKQVESGCRGLLNVISRKKAKVSFRMESVELTHRSLVEFFQKPDIQSRVQMHVGNFSFSQFAVQALVAELSACETCQSDSTDSLYFKDAYENDVYGLMGSIYHLSDGSVPAIVSGLQDLIRCVDRVAKPSQLVKLDIYPPCRWKDGEECGADSLHISCHPSLVTVGEAANYGICELWQSWCKSGINYDSGYGDAFDVYKLMTTTLNRHLRSADSATIPTPYGASSVAYKILADRCLKSFAVCLEGGVSPDDSAFAPCDIGKQIQDGHPTYWELLIWTSIHSPRLNLAPEPLMILFLLHGAKAEFWIKFDRSHDRTDKQGLVAVAPIWGTEKRQDFTPIFVPDEKSDLAEFAWKNDGYVSLEELLNFWIPARAEKLRRLIALNLGQGGGPPPASELLRLRKEYGFDVASWNPGDWISPPALFPTWTGTTHHIQLFGWND